MNIRNWLRLLAALFAFTMVVSACGGGDDETDDGAASEEGAESDDNMEEGESEDGDAMSEGGDAVGDVVEVATGTTLDLTACPSDWSATQGVDGDEIRIGISLPQSGNAAAFGAIANGMQAYFDHVNATDPIEGKNLVLVARDDAYESGRTVANVEEMLDTEDLFAFTYIIGSPHNLAVRPVLNEACVPQLFNATGLPDFGDPTNNPWTIGGLMAYNTEARLWCENIVSEKGEGATVAALFMNNDFGKAYQQGVQQCADEGLIELVASEVHDQVAPDIQGEMTNMITTEADVFILGSTGAFCPQAVGGVAASGWRPLFYMSNTCNNLATFFEPVKLAAGALATDGVGVRMANNVKQFTDPAYAEDEAINMGKTILTDAGLEATGGSQSTGIIFGYTIEQALRGAVENGGLNRVNLMKSAWNLDFVNPYLIDGVTTITDGTNDAYTTEAARIEEIVVTPEDALTLSPLTELISFEGEAGSVGN